MGALKTGEAAIRLELTAAAPSLAAGAHQLHYRNTHRADIGVYLANALVPASNRVSVTGQERDGDQQELTIAFALNGVRSTHLLAWSVTLISVIAVITALSMARATARAAARSAARPGFRSRQLS